MENYEKMKPEVIIETLDSVLLPMTYVNELAKNEAVTCFHECGKSTLYRNAILV